MDNKLAAEQIVSQAIQQVVFRYNAYAPIISAFRIAYTDIIPTLGVDKYARLVVNPEFIVKNEAFSVGLIIHEVLHVFFGHTTDTRSKLAYTDDAQHNARANMAEDCAINQFITEPLPAGAITPKTLGEKLGISLDRNKNAEYYYDKIIGQTPPQLEVPCSTGEVNTTAVQDELDKMGIPHISQEEVSDQVLQMAQEVVKAQGSHYGMLTDFALKMLEPKVNWKPLLQSAVRNAEKKIWNEHSRTTYKRVSRRSQQILLPKKYGNKINITISFDTSGSISQEMVRQFLSEVQNCLKFSEIKECALWHIHNYWYGTPAQLTQNIEKVFQSGGTNESCMGDAEKHCKADLHIHFSDGEHGTNYGFEHPSKNIEVIWNNNDIKEIRRF